MTARSCRASCSTKTDTTFGFNARPTPMRTWSQLGVIDPTKVVRTALQDAASVAGLLITTEATIAEAARRQACRCPQWAAAWAAWAAWTSDRERPEPSHSLAQDSFRSGRRLGFAEPVRRVPGFAGDRIGTFQPTGEPKKGPGSRLPGPFSYATLTRTLTASRATGMPQSPGPSSRARREPRHSAAAR
jgi:hypothetical protein